MKPDPLVMEYKDVCFGSSDHMTYLEIQEGKESMKKKKYKDFGTTLACITRALKLLCRYRER